MSQILIHIIFSAGISILQIFTIIRNHNPCVGGSIPSPATILKSKFHSEISISRVKIRVIPQTLYLPTLYSCLPVLSQSDATVMPSFGSRLLEKIRIFDRRKNAPHTSIGLGQQQIEGDSWGARKSILSKSP